VALSINEVKVGVTVLVDDQCWVVIDAQHVKPGKGAAFVRAKLRNLRLGTVQEKTFRGDEKVDEAYIEERKIQFQYKSGNMFHFMDLENYEDLAIAAEIVSDKADFIKDNLEMAALYYKEDCLNVSLPNFIEFTITDTEPGIKGDTAKSGTKPATIETGAQVQVPLFIDPSDKIKIDTRTGQYVERVNQ
jgi:elongation factor P